MGNCPKCQNGNIVWKEKEGDYICDFCGFAPLAAQLPKLGQKGIYQRRPSGLGSAIGKVGGNSYWTRLQRIQDRIRQSAEFVRRQQRTLAEGERLKAIFLPEITRIWKERSPSTKTLSQKGVLIMELAEQFNVSYNVIRFLLEDSEIFKGAGWALYTHRLVERWGKKVGMLWDQTKSLPGKGVYKESQRIGIIERKLKLTYSQIVAILSDLGFASSYTISYARRRVELAEQLGKIIIPMWNGERGYGKNTYQQAELIKKISTAIKCDPRDVASVLGDTETLERARSIWVEYLHTDVVLKAIKDKPATREALAKVVGKSYVFIFAVCQMLLDAKKIKKYESPFVPIGEKASVSYMLMPGDEKRAEEIAFEASIEFAIYQKVKEQPLTIPEAASLFKRNLGRVSVYLKKLMDLGYVKRILSDTHVYYSPGDEMRARLRAASFSPRIDIMISLLERDKKFGELKEELSSRVAERLLTRYLRNMISEGTIVRRGGPFRSSFGRFALSPSYRNLMTKTRGVLWKPRETS